MSITAERPDQKPDWLGVEEVIVLGMEIARTGDFWVPGAVNQVSNGEHLPGSRTGRVFFLGEQGHTQALLRAVWAVPIERER